MFPFSARQSGKLRSQVETTCAAWLRNPERIYTSVVYTSADRCGDWRHPGHRSPLASDIGCPPRPVWCAGPGTGWRLSGACGAGGSQLCRRNIPPAQSTFPLRLLCGCCSADCRLLCWHPVLFLVFTSHLLFLFYHRNASLRGLGSTARTSSELERSCFPIRKQWVQLDFM